MVASFLFKKKVVIIYANGEWRVCICVVILIVISLINKVYS